MRLLRFDVNYCKKSIYAMEDIIMSDSVFKGKTLLITGGTGSFGHTVSPMELVTWMEML